MGKGNVNISDDSMGNTCDDMVGKSNVNTRDDKVGTDSVNTSGDTMGKRQRQH